MLRIQLSSIHVTVHRQKTVWQNVSIHQTLQLKLKTKAFRYLPGMDSTNMKYVPHSILCSLQCTIKNINEMP